MLPKRLLQTFPRHFANNTPRLGTAQVCISKRPGACVNASVNLPGQKKEETVDTYENVGEKTEFMLRF